MVWLIGGVNVTVGASGLVFGLFAFLLVRGFFNRNWWQILLSVVLFLAYGGILFGILPTVAGFVSWQAHLGGAIGGVARSPAPEHPAGRNAAQPDSSAARQLTRTRVHAKTTPALPRRGGRRRCVAGTEGRCQPAYGLAEMISTVMSLPFGAV